MASGLAGSRNLNKVLGSSLFLISWARAPEGLPGPPMDREGVRACVRAGPGGWAEGCGGLGALPPPVSLASQSHHEKPPEVTCTRRGNPGFPASTRESPRETSFTFCMEIFKKYLFIWLPRILVSALGILVVACEILVPGPGIKPQPPALGVWSLNYCTPWGVLPWRFLNLRFLSY